MKATKTMLATYFCNELENWQKIGDGSFGKLYKGKLPSGKQIAIKIMKGNTDGTSWTEIGRLRNLDHPSILKLLAIVPLSGHDYDKNDEDNYCDCTDSIKFRTWLILEYMSFGSLKTFVSTRQCGLSAATMDKMAYQIAVGMNYLHRSANIVHRDLAARNILVGEHFEVKIADFGLCVEYFENQYYFGTHGKPCPVRWMSPENLPDAPPYTASGRYSRKGDVWSYGVVLYEIWTRGKMPLGNLDDEDVMYQVKNYGISVLTPNYGFPVHARSWVIEVMKMCFQYNKNKRPNFRQITNYIQNHSDYRIS